jgi:hypothetical protein
MEKISLRQISHSLKKYLLASRYAESVLQKDLTTAQSSYTLVNLVLTSEVKLENASNFSAKLFGIRQQLLN